jgi:hypothetical protein
MQWQLVLRLRVLLFLQFKDFVDKNFRKFILKQVKDPILKKFWEEEFASMSTNSRLVTEAVAPIQNKVGRFISTAVIRNIIGQVKSTIDLREIMDNKKNFSCKSCTGKNRRGKLFASWRYVNN